MACHITGGFSSLEGARERTVWRRPGRQRALHWSDPAEVATQSAIIEQLGQLTKCARVSFKRILTVNTTLESNYCCSVFRLKFVDLAKSVIRTYSRSPKNPALQQLQKTSNSRHVRAIPWPSGRWRARRRIDTVHAGRLHGREHTRGHVQPRCRGGGGVGRGKRCRRCHRSGGGPPAWRNAHGRGHHPAAQRTCTQRAGRPTRRTGGRVGSTAARRGASSRTGRWRQKPPTRRRKRSRRAGTITRRSSRANPKPRLCHALPSTET